MNTSLVCNNGITLMYLDARTLEFPKSKDNPSQCPVVVKVCNEECRVMAERLEGGQRLLLPTDAQQWIVANLLEGNGVTLSTGRYEATLNP